MSKQEKPMSAEEWRSSRYKDASQGHQALMNSLSWTATDAEQFAQYLSDFKLREREKVWEIWWSDIESQFNQMIGSKYESHQKLAMKRLTELLSHGPEERGD